MKKLFYSKRTAPIVALLLAVCVLGSIASATRHVPSAMRRVPDAELMEIRGMMPCNCCIPVFACTEFEVDIEDCAAWSDGTCKDLGADCNALMSWYYDETCRPEPSDPSANCAVEVNYVCVTYQKGNCIQSLTSCSCGNLSTTTYSDGVRPKCEQPYSDWCD